MPHVMHARDTNRTCPIKGAELSRSCALIITIMLALHLAGCSAPSGPASWTVERDDFDRAFDAAVIALADAGYVSAVRDRSGGVIESEPLRIGGALEPWHAIGQPWSTTGESTLTLQRRRARVEFSTPDQTDGTTSSRVEPQGPDVVGAAAPDVRTSDGPLVARVWVAIERAHTPGIRRFTWTRSLTTRYIDPADPIDPADGVVATSIWTPIGRDEDAERRIAERIRALLDAS